ncbi:ferrochelatase [Corynebacterium kroppenstedtii]
MAGQGASTIRCSASDGNEDDRSTTTPADGSQHGGLLVTNRPVDAIVVASFGGPEGPRDVRPFLENVTRGRGIPSERLDAVEKHYQHFNGISPLNELNREIIQHLEEELHRQHRDLPIYFANRNWHPLWNDTIEKMAADGVRHALVFITSAWAGYSGCRQYDEDIEKAREHCHHRGITPPDLTRLRQFHDHPEFIDAEAEAIQDALNRIPSDRREHCRIVFTAHSIPLSADKESGNPDDGDYLYSRQIHESARLTASRLGITDADYDVVWQSRSGPPQIPWLEPDIVDHISALHDRGIPAAVVSPIGFVSDHVEVIWDLDTELAHEARDFTMVIERAATVGPTKRFTRMIIDLIDEYMEGREPTRLGTEPQQGYTLNGAPYREKPTEYPNTHRVHR